MGFKDIFKTAAPFLSAAIPLPPPFGQLATSAIGKALGVDNVTPDKVDDVVAQAARKDPDVLLKLKQAEQDFASQMQAAGFKQVDDLLALDNADRQSARQREMTVKDRTPMILAFSVVALTFFMEGWIVFHGAGKDLDPVIVGRILGTLDSALIMVLAYYFGSSAGSQAKDATIHQVVTQQGGNGK